MPATGDKQNSIFRANALKNLNMIDERFDLFRIVGYSSWLWLLFAIVFVSAILVWTIDGSIAITVQGRGIILPEGGKALSIYSTYEGTATSVLGKQGLFVRKGDILAKIHNPYIEEDLEFNEKKYHENDEQFQKFKNEYLESIKELKIKSEQVNHNLNEKIIHIQDKMISLKSIYQNKMELYKKRYLTIIDIEKAKDEYLSAKEELAILKQDLFESKLKNIDELSQLEEKLKRYQMTYLDGKHAYDLKMLEKNNGSTIVSSENGIINNVAITDGDHIVAGKQLFTIISRANNNKLEALIFVSHSDGKKVNEGMDVNVLPNEVSAYDYGYIKGKVVSVTEYPASRDSVNTYLGNLNLVDEYFAGGVPYMVKVLLTENNKIKSGLSWTTRNGAPFKIKPGTTVTAKITTRISSPINTLLKNLDVS